MVVLSQEMPALIYSGTVLLDASSCAEERRGEEMEIYIELKLRT